MPTISMQYRQCQEERRRGSTTTYSERARAVLVDIVGFGEDVAEELEGRAQGSEGLDDTYCMSVVSEEAEVCAVPVDSSSTVDNLH